MIPTFTGNSRPRRQVNLSGRTNNPFASASNRSPSLPTHNAVAHAQQERIQRQRERERPPAAATIQRVWRGYKGRSVVKSRWREEWDALESDASDGDPYPDETICRNQLRLLVQFASSISHADLLRLYRFTTRFMKTPELRTPTSRSRPEIWVTPLALLARLTIGTFNNLGPTYPDSFPFGRLLDLLNFLSYSIPYRISGIGYYKAMLFTAKSWPNSSTFDSRKLQSAVSALVDSAGSDMRINPEVDSSRHSNLYSSVYEGFAWHLLTEAAISSVLDLDALSTRLDYRLLTTAIENKVVGLAKISSRGEVLWLLAYYIYFGRRSDREESDPSYVGTVSALLSFSAPEIESRIQNPGSTVSPTANPLPNFVEQQLLSLVNQDSVRLVVGFIEGSTASKASEMTKQASALATYVLTLMRVFPRKADDIRMWLFLAGAGSSSARDKVPAVKYLYESIRQSTVFTSISRDPRESITLLKPNFDPSMRRLPETKLESREREWRIILLFLELYKFVLMIMDDEEFLSGSSAYDETLELAWTRQSALPINKVSELVYFLKHLAFSLYWYGPEIRGIQKEDSRDGLSVYFGSNPPTNVSGFVPSSPRHEDQSLAGMPGMTLTHLKGMVTGVLRMLYERDSRRKFLPAGHWLMTRYFEMDRFIAAVVDEEEAKNSMGEFDAELQEEEGLDYADEEDDEESMVGTSRTQRLRHIERLRERQQQIARKRDLDLIAPRLEILQNMPFFIPFATRVQIFRQFVRNEQRERRGFEDPDDWRFAMMQVHTQDMSKHKATVHRESIFDDAFEQFYSLKQDLKEPIQIKFVDKFGTEEEGIDGGGVTKEFLTSITTEAFASNSDNLDLFIENDQHLLFPNPSAVDERRDLLTQAGLQDSDPEWIASVRDLLQRYEFLGRIIGKCMYEGILVDVPFAGFFLIKWALTGGSGFASRESGYRANLNDLRDLDEGLYQGLLQLKNHIGNVEDFALNFTIEDAIEQRRRDNKSPANNKTVTRELQPGGASISVTNENRLLYISLVARHRLKIQPYPQTSAFLRGLDQIVSSSWLSMFNQSELQTLISGSRGEIDVSDLRRNTLYGGLYAIGDDGQEHPTVQMFWKALELMSDNDRRKVLKFVTSTPRAPLLGFDQLNPRFSIRDSGNDQTRLPTTSTCVNLLKLPAYKSLGVLKERLLYSVNAGAGFNLS